MGDPDANIIDVGDGHSSFIEGVHLGHTVPLALVPQVYRARTKEPTYDESEWSLTMDNYFKGSEAEAQRILEDYFKEGELEGCMQPMSEKEAAKRYPGDSLRIAAQGILDKPDGETPGLGSAGLQSVTGIRSGMAQQVASAAFWLSRLMGLLGRHSINLMSDEWFFVLVFVDDLHLAAGGRDRWASIWKFIASLEMLGAPFSYRKFRGGFTLDYVGYWLDYGRFQLGISERRAAWLVDFIDKLEMDQWLIMTRRFQEFQGRLCFSAQVLPWVRPLLAPGYAWLAAVGKASTVKVPELVAMVCVFIRAKFKKGLRKAPCAKAEHQLGELFRTDAKCENGKVVVGGWKIPESGKPLDAPWFSLEVSPKQAPWLFRGEDHSSSWASTSAELLSSLVALKVFELGAPSTDRQSATHLLKCGGGTDNKAASRLVRKRLSTKIPLMIVLMDYLGFCEEQGLHCQLDWRPRDTNIEADQLTNGIFDSFDLSRRLNVTWEQLDFPMISYLMKFAESFSKRKTLDTPPSGGEGREKFIKSSWG
eukprot:s658_g12.t1